MHLLSSRLIFAIFFGLFICSCQTPQPPANSSSDTKTGNTSKAQNNQRRPVANTGTAAWTLLDSRRMRMADYAGKVVVLDFWATYCPPCVAEAPHLAELQRRYEKQGLTVVGLNVGGPEDQPKIPEFVQQTKVQYDIGFPDGALVESLMGADDTIPQTFVFDRKGQLVKSFVGYNPGIAAEIESSIQAALNASQ